MTSSRDIHLAISASLKIACVILLLSAAVMASPFYKFSVVAETGKTVPGTSDLLTSIDRNVSINRNVKLRQRHVSTKQRQLSLTEWRTT